jgi:hypothetical protein
MLPKLQFYPDKVLANAIGKGFKADEPSIIYYCTAAFQYLEEEYCNKFNFESKKVIFLSF